MADPSVMPTNSPSAPSSVAEHRPDKPEVPAFESWGADQLHRKWEVALGEDLRCQTGVYLRRWRLETPWFSIRLHHWFSSDDDRHPHDHPWNFWTLILKGTYIDEGVNASQRVRAGRIYYRPATHAHWVHLDQGEVWTLLLTGPKIRRWGFWIDGARKWIKNFKYFYRYGEHPCD